MHEGLRAPVLSGSPRARRSAQERDDGLGFTLRVQRPKQKVLGPNINAIWAPKPYFWGPWTLSVRVQGKTRNAIRIRLTGYNLLGAAIALCIALAHITQGRKKGSVCAVPTTPHYWVGGCCSNVRGNYLLYEYKELHTAKSIKDPQQ